VNDVLRDFVIWLAGFFAVAVGYLAIVHLAAAKYWSMRSRQRGDSQAPAWEPAGVGSSASPRVW
jgi:hypothetical protein